jgi:hypothetical protein
MLPIAFASNNESNQGVCLFTEDDTNIMKKLLTVPFCEFGNEVDAFRKENNLFYNFLCRYKNKSIRLDDPKLLYWLNHVAPSCIYPNRVNGIISHFSCAICQAVVRTQVSLIRHYQEQHYEQMPQNIFGIKIIYSCETCSVTFNRANQLEQHKLSVKHLNKVGNPQAAEVLSTFKEAKSTAAQIKKSKRKFEQAKEETTWNKKKKSLQEQNDETSEHESEVEEVTDLIIDSQVKHSEDEDVKETHVENIKHSDKSSSQLQIEANDNEDNVEPSQTKSQNERRTHQADDHDVDDLACSQLSQLSVKN